MRFLLVLYIIQTAFINKLMKINKINFQIEKNYIYKRKKLLSLVTAIPFRK